MNKARGKSGPLFSFDVHDDIRLMTDATVEKDEVRDQVTRALLLSIIVTLSVPCGEGGLA